MQKQQVLAMGDTQKKIGAVIKRLRKSKKWTQDRLSEATGNKFEPSHISRIENGGLGTPIPTLECLANALSVGIDEIISEAIGKETADPRPDPAKYSPLIDIETAGQDIPKAPPGAEDMPNWLPTPKGCSPKTFAIKVTDDTMTSPVGLSIPAGSIAFVDPMDKDLKPNKIALIQNSEGEYSYIRQISITGGTTYLKPLNQQYQSDVITDNHHVVGTIKDISYSSLLS